MEKKEMVKGFNLWMEDYIKNPTAFLKTQQSISRYLLEKANGEQVTYGERCEASLTYYVSIT